MARSAKAKLLGDRVRERLALVEGTQVTLAKAAGMRQQGVQMIIGGVVERPRKLREIARYLKTTQEYLLGETNDPRLPSPSTSAEGLAVPIISWVSAGKLVDPQVPIPDNDRTILVDDLGPGDWFALDVDGESMNRLSPHGSVIVVNQRDRILLTGKAYVFAVRGEVTFKLWHARPLYLAPYSTDPAIEPIFIERKRDLEVIGRVRRTILDL